MILNKTARNNLNKLVHVINEVRNTQVVFMHDDDNKYRNMATAAIADYLQEVVNTYEDRKHTSGVGNLQNDLKQFSAIDVETTAGFHSQCMIQAMEEAIDKVAWAHAKLGLFTTEDWRAAAEFVSMKQLARDVCEDWLKKLSK